MWRIIVRPECPNGSGEHMTEERLYSEVMIQALLSQTSVSSISYYSCVKAMCDQTICTY